MGCFHTVFQIPGEVRHGLLDSSGLNTDHPNQCVLLFGVTQWKNSLTQEFNFYSRKFNGLFGDYRTRKSLLEKVLHSH